MSQRLPEEQSRGIESVVQFYLSQSSGVGLGKPKRQGPGQREEVAGVEGGGVAGKSIGGVGSGESSEVGSDASGGAGLNEKFVSEEAKGICSGDDCGEEVMKGGGDDVGDSVESSEFVRRGRRGLSSVILLADHLAGGGIGAVKEFSRQWAAKNEWVGLIRISDEGVELSEFSGQLSEEGLVSSAELDELFGVSGGEELPEIGEDDFGRVDEGTIFEGLDIIRERSDTLLIDIGRDMLAEEEGLLAVSRHVVVFASEETDDILGAYKAIKWLGPAAWKDKDVSVFVTGVETEQAGREVHRKLSETAWEFLGIKLNWAGWLVGSVVASGEKILVHGDDVEAAVGAVLEFVGQRGVVELRKAEEAADETGKVDKQETEWAEKNYSQEDQLKDKVEEDATQSTRSGSEILESEEICQECPSRSVDEGAHVVSGPVGQGRPLPLTALAVDKLPQDDKRLCDELVLGLPRWLTVVPTALAVPLCLPAEFDRSLRILLDGGGRLQVLAVKMSGEGEVLGRALRLRKWLRDNMEMVVAHCRQIKIDRALEVGVILVVGGAAENMRQSCSQLSDFPCQVLQVHLLQSELGNSVLVV
ncbi:MAG: hypothetical protein JXD22_02755 [Sedimentisphaerales bacterium]|nr:hypothetical protein [Sedimentisphaerales bacterium]